MNVTALEIAADHPAFAGHFPGMPILPGAVLLDEALRVVAQNLALDLTHWQIASAKFLDSVRPGESLIVEHSAAAHDSIRFIVRVADRTALAGTLTLSAGGSAHAA
jgi:3-hydroxymyristoyl/3-hydroxydecanoyl-(acyl carrier protein) dehydratase